jgi:predicted DsbA family dithiol-disulfide isomerase
MDEYLSVPGSYVFVRREPEGMQPDRLVMTVFEDFMCPACYQAATELFPSLKNKYGDKLEIRFLAFPFVHQESGLAARAHAVAHELGFGNEMQKALFRAHFEQQIDVASKDGIAKVADSIGLAPEVLLTQLEGDGGKAELERTLTQANSYQVDGTPTIVFDGWIKVTDLSTENLGQIIDGLLARKKPAMGKAAKPASSGRKTAP